MAESRRTPSPPTPLPPGERGELTADLLSLSYNIFHKITPMDLLNREALTWYLLRITPSLFEWAMILLPLTLYLLWLGFEVGRKKQPYVLTGTLDTLLL